MTGFDQRGGAGSGFHDPRMPQPFVEPLTILVVLAAFVLAALADWRSFRCGRRRRGGLGRHALAGFAKILEILVAVAPSVTVALALVAFGRFARSGGRLCAFLRSLLGTMGGAGLLPPALLPS